MVPRQNPNPSAEDVLISVADYVKHLEAVKAARENKSIEEIIEEMKKELHKWYPVRKYPERAIQAVFLTCRVWL